MNVCDPCRTFCQQRTQRAVALGGKARDDDFMLVPHPECAEWTVCNCACQASVRAEERRRMHTRGRAPAEKVELPEPLFDL